MHPPLVRAGVEALGDRILGVFDNMGEFSRLAGRSFRVAARRHFPLREIVVR